MNSDQSDKKVSWRDLPKMAFSRKDAPAKGAGSSDAVVHNVRSAETLGAEFDNRKLGLGVTKGRKGRL